MIQVQRELDGLVNGSSAGSGLAGCRCGDCKAVYFPRRSSCERCASENMHPANLPVCGEVWSWTSQAYPPPSPPYLFKQDRTDFEPYHVGYVDLGETLVLARLDYSAGRKPRIGDIVNLNWSLMPLPDGELRIPVFSKGGAR